MEKNLLICGGYPWLDPAALHAIIKRLSARSDVRVILIDASWRGEFDDCADEVEMIPVADSSETLSSLCQQLETLTPQKETVLIINEFSYMIDPSSKEGRQQSRANLKSILKLAKEGGRVGIRLIITDRHPMTEVITKEIRELFPLRLAFRVSSKEDSKLILGYYGAEKLRSPGEALYYNGTLNSPRKCYITGCGYLQTHY